MRNNKRVRWKRKEKKLQGKILIKLTLKTTMMGGDESCKWNKKKTSCISLEERIPDPPANMKASPWPDSFCLKNPYKKEHGLRGMIGGMHDKETCLTGLTKHSSPILQCHFL